MKEGKEKVCSSKLNCKPNVTVCNVVKRKNQ